MKNFLANIIVYMLIFANNENVGRLAMSIYIYIYAYTQMGIFINVINLVTVFTLIGKVLDETFKGQQEEKE